MALKEKEQFPKDDFGVIVENNNGKEIINYLVSKGFSNYFYFTGDVNNNEFYYINKNDNIIRCTSSNSTSKTYTLEQLKQLDNNNMEKKIIGWKLKKDCEKYREVCKKIKFAQNGLTSDYLEGKTEIWVGKDDTCLRECLEEAKVWNLWFEPVYEPEKPKKKVITLSNNKSVIVIKEGVRVECRLIPIKYIETLFNTGRFACTEWKLQINNFDIGCYKNLNRKDLENILEAYKSLN